MLDSCGVTPDAIQLVEDTNRETAKKLMQMNEYLDVLIPRGGAGLIRTVVENSTVPVIETVQETVIFMWMILQTLRWQ